jgi:hypothetical protein
MHRNSLRLRLSVDEWQKLKDCRPVDEFIPLGLQAGFIYVLESSDEFKLSWDNNRLVIAVPAGKIEECASDHLVGFEHEFQWGNQCLKLLVEKDFKCLTPRNEDESRLFENPNQKC